MTVTFLDSNPVNPGNAANASIAVAGPALANDIAVVAVYKESTAAITPPDGTWTQLAVDTTNASTQGGLTIFWKRLTGVDTGSYNFTWTGTTYRAAQLLGIRGCATAGSPWVSGSTILRTANNAGTTINTSVTAVDGGMGISFVSSWATVSRSWTVPSGWTKPQQNAVSASGYKAGLSAGSTGTVSWVGNGNDYYQMFLGVLKPPSPSSVPYPVVSGVKKTTSGLYAVVSGLKKSATAYSIIGGVKK
jgi:hypothetical protein